MNDILKKEQRAISYLRAFAPKDGSPYHLCYSGGKDSDVIRILAGLAEVPHEIHHNLTTADAPETVYYVKSIPGVIVDRPPITMWKLIEKKKMPPTRIARYCCEVLKERNGAGKIKVTGVRWDESAKREESADIVRIIGKPKTTMREADERCVKYRTSIQGGVILNDDNDENRRFVEHCYRTTSTMINPIVDWTESDVWEFLHHYGCESNPLYKCGFKRIGCIGCPMASKSRKFEFARYPKYKSAYIRAFDKMLKARKEAGLESNGCWESGEMVFKWWMEEDPLQMSFFDENDY